MADQCYTTLFCVKKQAMTHIKHTLFFLLLAITPFTSWAQTPESVAVATIFDHWYTGDDQAIDLHIQTNLGQLFRNPD